MEAYSPYAQLRWGAQLQAEGASYPAMLLTAAERDTRVDYSQSIRYLARLRHRSRAASGAAELAEAPPQLLHVRAQGGHLADGGRYRRLEQCAAERKKGCSSPLPKAKCGPRHPGCRAVRLDVE